MRRQAAREKYAECCSLKNFLLLLSDCLGDCQVLKIFCQNLMRVKWKFLPIVLSYMHKILQRSVGKYLLITKYLHTNILVMSFSGKPHNMK